MKFLSIFIGIMICQISFAQDFVEINVLNDKVSILAPQDFLPMSAELIELKYPATSRPTKVLSDETGGVSLAFNHTNTPMRPDQVNEAFNAISSMFRNIFPTAKWIREEVIEQNGTQFMVLELITPAVDTDIHNIIYGTSVDGRFF